MSDGDYQIEDRGYEVPSSFNLEQYSILEQLKEEYYYECLIKTNE